MSLFQIETPRLTLRPFHPDDLKSYLSYWNHPDYLRYYAWEAPVQSQGEQLFQKILSWQTNHPVRKYQFSAIERKSGLLIGNCGCRRQDDNELEADIGYELDPHYWGQGFGTELASAMIAFGFQVLNVHRIFAEVISENTASQRILAKWMKKEAHFRDKEFFKHRFWDCCVYAILKNEYDISASKSCHFLQIP